MFNFVLSFILAVIMLLIYDFYGFIIMNKFNKIKSEFKIPIGFICILAMFQILALPFMIYKLKFWIIYVFFIPLFIMYLVYRFSDKELRLKYFESLKEINYMYIILSLITFFLVYFTPNAWVDQFLYAAQTNSMVNTGITNYYFEDFTTIMQGSGIGVHGYNSFYLFMASILKMFNLDYYDFFLGAYKLVDCFIFVGLIGIINKYFLKENWISFILLTLGMTLLPLFGIYFGINDFQILINSVSMGTVYAFIVCFVGVFSFKFLNLNEKETIIYWTVILLFLNATTTTYNLIIVFAFLAINMLTGLKREYYIVGAIWLFILAIQHGLLLGILSLIPCFILYIFYKKKIILPKILLYIVYISAIVALVLISKFELKGISSIFMLATLILGNSNMKYRNILIGIIIGMTIYSMFDINDIPNYRIKELSIVAVGIIFMFNRDKNIKFYLNFGGLIYILTYFINNPSTPETDITYIIIFNRMFLFVPFALYFLYIIIQTKLKYLFLGIYILVAINTQINFTDGDIKIPILNQVKDQITQSRRVLYFGDYKDFFEFPMNIGDEVLIYPKDETSGYDELKHINSSKGYLNVYPYKEKEEFCQGNNENNDCYILKLQEHVMEGYDDYETIVSKEKFEILKKEK